MVVAPKLTPKSVHSVKKVFTPASAGKHHAHSGSGGSGGGGGGKSNGRNGNDENVENASAVPEPDYVISDYGDTSSEEAEAENDDEASSDDGANTDDTDDNSSAKRVPTWARKEHLHK